MIIVLKYFQIHYMLIGGACVSVSYNMHLRSMWSLLFTESSLAGFLAMQHRARTASCIGGRKIDVCYNLVLGLDWLKYARKVKSVYPSYTGIYGLTRDWLVRLMMTEWKAQKRLDIMLCSSEKIGLEKELASIHLALHFRRCSSWCVVLGSFAV